MTMPNAPMRRARHGGFTIVEFLVAMTIGLIVSLALGQIFLGVRQSFSSQEDSSRMQENMRFAAQALSRALRQAGYRNQPAVAASEVFPMATSPAIEGADSVSTSGLPSGNADSTKPTAPTNATVTPDTVTVRYQGSGTGSAADGTIVDCLGNSIDYGVMARNTFAIRGVTKPDGTVSSSLFCSTDGTTWPANNELIPDVDNMQILYGVDTDANGAADKYVRYGDIGAVTGNIDKVVSVRIWLLLRSATPTQTRAEAATYNLAGTSFIYNDRFQRRVLYMTVNLRNRTL